MSPLRRSVLSAELPVGVGICGRRVDLRDPKTDTLHGIVKELQSVVEQSDGLPKEKAETLADAVARLSGFLAHYRSVLVAHNISLPFFESPDG
jgi:hypothetical protein